MIIFNVAKLYRDNPASTVIGLPYGNNRVIAESTYGRWYRNDNIPINAGCAILVNRNGDARKYTKVTNPDPGRRPKFILSAGPHINLKLFDVVLRYEKGLQVKDLVKYGITEEKHLQIMRGDYSNIWSKDLEIMFNESHYYIGNFASIGIEGAYFPYEKDTIDIFDLENDKIKRIIQSFRQIK